MKKTAICICNYNKKEMVISCLKAVSEQKEKDIDIYICDNASTDGSAEAISDFIREHGEYDITLLANKENLGGAGGFNRALGAALDSEEAYSYLMCVDNDCLLDEGCVGALEDYLDRDPSSGMAAAKVYFLDNPSIIQCFGLDISYELCGTISPYFGKPEDGSGPDVIYSDAAPACALMVRSDLIRQIGLLPEENYIYWDDTTWCYRARCAGYRIANVGAAMALHGMGQRAEIRNTFGTYYSWRNQIRYFMLTSPQDKLYDVAIRLLTDVYLEVTADYECHRAKRAAAVMAALDDALHGITGKAREGIICDIPGSDHDVVYESVDSLPDKYRAGAEIFIYSHYELFINACDRLRKETE